MQYMAVLDIVISKVNKKKFKKRDIIHTNLIKLSAVTPHKYCMKYIYYNVLPP
jgi:hypothetical protein